MHKLTPLPSLMRNLTVTALSFSSELFTCCLTFIFEKKVKSKLPFLDVLLEKADSKFFTSVYYTPTFTGQDVCWNSFSFPKQRTNLIEILMHQALSICSELRLPQDLDNIKTILHKNGYPGSAIQKDMSKAIVELRASKKESPPKCQIYLRLPWTSNTSHKFQKQIKTAVSNWYRTMNFG